MRAPRSLQGQLLALVLGTVTAVWLVVAGSIWLDARHELDELLDGHLAQSAALLVARHGPEAPETTEHDPPTDTPTLHRYAPKVAFQIVDDGRVTLRSANAPALPMVEAAKRFRSGFSTVRIDGVEWRVFAAHGREPDVRVYVGEQTASRTSILQALLRSTLWPMLFALPLLGLAVWWAIHRGMRPIRRLGPLLAARQPDDLDPVGVPGAPSEMTPMIEALNGLFRRIETLLDSANRFTADAAHELRTPIAAIRAQAQVALAENHDQRRRHALEATVAGCDRAARLVAQLLTLSRLDADGHAAAEALDFGALVRAVVADLAPMAIGKGQQIAVEAEPGCRVRGDRTLFEVLVRNLVDNAIRYSPEGASVRISVADAGGGVRFGVEDSGPGMTPQGIARFDERFFRVIGSGENGSGLGGSIVRRIVQVQHATLTISRSPQLGGLAVEVAWPPPLLASES